MKINIITGSGLPELSARINRKTYDAIRRATGDSAFLPDGDCIVVARDPFRPDYILHITSEAEVADNVLNVSNDVKTKFYGNTEHLEF
jgi:hypothetical protein